MIQSREIPQVEMKERGDMIYYIESLSAEGKWDNIGIFVKGTDLVITNDRTEKACAIDLHSILSEYKRWVE